MSGLKKPKSAREAEELGQTFYFTEKPCKNGHTAPRYTKTRQCVDCNKQWSSDYYKSDRGKSKSKFRAIKRNYGLSEEDVTELHLQHNNRCAICKQEKKLVIDHNHTTGEVRGLLCDSCNKALGMFCDNISFLSSAIIYLERTK